MILKILYSSIVLLAGFLVWVEFDANSQVNQTKRDIKQELQRVKTNRKFPSKSKVDHWGEPYTYSVMKDTKSVVIQSSGIDRIMGTHDDITDIIKF